jgi:hypothetical protein
LQQRQVAEAGSQGRRASVADAALLQVEWREARPDRAKYPLIFFCVRCVRGLGWASL